MHGDIFIFIFIFSLCYYVFGLDKYREWKKIEFPKEYYI